MIDFFINNYELAIKLFTYLIIVGISLFIYFKAIKLHSLSNYKGFKIFGIAFLYFAIAYLLNFILVLMDFLLNFYNYQILGFLLFLVFYYSISMAGLMLVYSLVWKEFEKKDTKLANNKILLLNIIGIIIGAGSIYDEGVMFLIILSLLSYAIILSYTNYKKIRITGKKNDFSQLYFITMVLAFIAYLSNFLVGFFPLIRIYVSLITTGIFLIFLYGVLKVTK